jgi:hypothetical protein
MKIIPKEVIAVSGDQSSKKTPVSPNANFGSILKEAMDVTSTAGGQATAVPPLDSLAKIAMESTNQASRADTVERINRFMDILESYQSGMEDAAATLKQVSPLVTQMEEEAQNLIPVLESLPAGDELKDILNRLLVASTVEVIKFNRGDYVA